MKTSDAIKELEAVKLELAKVLCENPQDTAELQRLVKRYHLLVPASYEELRVLLEEANFVEIVKEEQNFLEVIHSAVNHSRQATRSKLLELNKGRKAKNAY